MPLPWLNALVHNPIMLDAVEDLIGPDILCWESSFFTEKARDPRFVPWRQDSTHYGLRPAETVTAWVAFTDSKIPSGCVRFAPGAHRDGIRDHAETRDADNLLMKRQTVMGIDEGAAVDCELDAGEISIHHESVVHGSNPNTSDGPWIGLSIHYIAPHVRQTAFDRATAMVVRGRDAHGFWEARARAQKDLDPTYLAALDDVYAQYRSGAGKLSRAEDDATPARPEPFNRALRSFFDFAGARRSNLSQG